MDRFRPQWPAQHPDQRRDHGVLPAQRICPGPRPPWWSRALTYWGFDAVAVERWVGHRHGGRVPAVGVAAVVGVVTGATLVALALLPGPVPALVADGPGSPATTGGPATTGTPAPRTQGTPTTSRSAPATTDAAPSGTTLRAPAPSATPTTPVPPPAPVVYEAEAAPHGGSRVLTVENASAGDVLASLNRAGDWVQIVTTGEAARDATVVLRYSNHHSHEGTLSLYRDGILLGRVGLPPTGATSTFAEVTVPVPLAAGPNVIGIVRTGQDTGSIVLDSVTVA